MHSIINHSNWMKSKSKSLLKYGSTHELVLENMDSPNTWTTPFLANTLVHIYVGKANWRHNRRSNRKEKVHTYCFNPWVCCSNQLWFPLLYASFYLHSFCLIENEIEETQSIYIFTYRIGMDTDGYNNTSEEVSRLAKRSHIFDFSDLLYTFHVLFHSFPSIHSFHARKAPQEVVRYVRYVRYWGPSPRRGRSTNTDSTDNTDNPIKVHTVRRMPNTYKKADPPRS